MSQQLSGGCYCGNISIDFHTNLDPANMTPRACDCAFCRRNGAVWISDPGGKIDIAIMNEAALSLYEQGSMSAKFWICQRCGTASAVTCEINGSLHGAINVNCLEENDAFGEPIPVSPRKLEADEKVCRWAELWTRNVVVKEAWDVGL